MVDLFSKHRQVKQPIDESLARRNPCEDVWHYISLHNVPYNRIYDWLYVKNMPIPKIRVSNLIHEKSFRCLTLLQEFEPDTYNKLVERLPGVQTAALYGEEQSVYNAKKLPEAFKTWAEYRDHLITSMPDRQAADRFIKRFAGHLDDEHVHRQQVRQLLLKDWENSLPVTNKAKDMAARQKWMEIL
jgi:predicted phosphoadenosine phosphosulfate sulfurtransferase